MMKRLLKLVLLSVVVLLTSTQQRTNYEGLGYEVREHVDKAISRADQQFRHLNKQISLYKLLGDPVTSTNHLVRVLLTTMCPVAKSGSEHTQGKSCELIEKRARWFDCIVCKKRGGGEHVDCALFKDEAKRNKMEDECDTYFHGGKIAMRTSPGHDEFGCVGCV